LPQPPEVPLFRRYQMKKRRAATGALLRLSTIDAVTGSHVITAVR